MANIFTPLPEDKKAKTLIGSSPVVLNVSKKILARQSIFRKIDCNITHDIKRGPSFITEQQIKMSSIYQKLLQRIHKAKTRQQQEIKQDQKTMERMANEIQYLKATVQQDKVEMWEAKNEILELQELLEQEMEQYNAICEEIRAEQEDEDDFDEEEDQNNEDASSNDQNTNEASSTSQGTYQLQTNKSEQQLSKPSCSIKYFISNRTITSPGLSKENLQMGEGINFNSHKDSSKNHGQCLSKKEEQQSCTEHLLSFKKSQKLFCEEN